jgi:hypothetical protein
MSHPVKLVVTDDLLYLLTSSYPYSGPTASSSVVAEPPLTPPPDTVATPA